MTKPFCTVALMLTLAGPAAAQDPILALNPTTMVGYAGTVAAGEMAKRRVGRSPASARRTAPLQATVTPAEAARRLSFRPDPAVRNQVTARAVAMARRTSPQEAETLRTALASGETWKAANQYLARYGMSSTNVVDTTALYLASAWFASRANSGDPTPAQMTGLRRQVAATMSGMPALLSAKDALKQDLSDANIIQALLASSLANAAARDPKNAGPMRAAAVRGAMESYRIDISKLNLTAQGFR